MELENAKGTWLFISACAVQLGIIFCSLILSILYLIFSLYEHLKKVLDRQGVQDGNKHQ